MNQEVVYFVNSKLEKIDGDDYIWLFINESYAFVKRFLDVQNDGFFNSDEYSYKVISNSISPNLILKAYVYGYIDFDFDFIELNNAPEDTKMSDFFKRKNNKLYINTEIFNALFDDLHPFNVKGKGITAITLFESNIKSLLNNYIDVINKSEAYPLNEGYVMVLYMRMVKELSYDDIINYVRIFPDEIYDYTHLLMIENDRKNETELLSNYIEIRNRFIWYDIKNRYQALMNKSYEDEDGKTLYKPINWQNVFDRIVENQGDDIDISGVSPGSSFMGLVKKEADRQITETENNIKEIREVLEELYEDKLNRRRNSARKNSDYQILNDVNNITSVKNMKRYITSNQGIILSFKPF